MSKRRTKKDKIISRLRRQSVPPLPSPPSPQSTVFPLVKRQTITSPSLSTPAVIPAKLTQYSAISPHTTAVKQSLLKTLILAVGLAVFELVIYWAWR